jgi:hypothetical protein
MKKDILNNLAQSLDRAINPIARKVEATTRILERVEPLPVVNRSAEDCPTPIEDAKGPSAFPLQNAPDRAGEAVEKTLVNKTTVVKREYSGWPKTTVAKMTTVDEMARVKGELRIPNTIMDVLLPTLEPSAAVLYLRLFRLSHGYRKDECVVGLQKLGNSTNTSQKTVQRALVCLEKRQLVERIGASFGGQQKGNHFKVNLPGSLANLTMDKTATVDDAATLDNLTTVANLTDNKRNNELLKSNNHQSGTELSFPHLVQTITAYTAATKNPWLESDTVTYLQHNISQIPIAELKSIIQSVMQRSRGGINSLNYFVKELLEWNSPERTTRRKTKLEAIAKRVRDLHVGKANYSMADFIANFRNACVREGVEFEPDLSGEITRESAAEE